MASSITFDDLPSKLKDYAMDDNNQLLSRVLIDNNNFLSGQGGYARLIPGVNDEYPLTEVEMGDIVQPGNKDAFNPLNDKVKLKARIGKVRPCKVDLQFKPTQVQNLWKTYLGKVQQATPENPYDMPFEAFILEQIIKKAKENIRLKAMWKGVYDSTGSTPKTTMDGLLVKLKAAQVDGSIASSQIATLGTIDDANAVTKFETLIDLVNEAYRDSPDLVAIASPRIIQSYFRDYRSSYNALPYNQTYKKNAIDGTNCGLYAEPGLSGSDMLMITTIDNLVWLADDMAKLDNIIIEKEKRNINIMMDFNCAPDLALAAEIWMNDAAVYPADL